MEKKNLFITNYSRIEQEVIKLSQYVDFCDEQLSVYSPVICDLLIRCGVEIESLCKELFRKDIGGELPGTVGEITKELDRLYTASKKVVLFNNRCFNFNSFTKIVPFSYKRGSEDDFYNLYCELKHDRVNNYHKATLRMLLLSLGGLYILNQFYLDKVIPIRNDFFGEDIPDLLSENTEFFTTQVLNCDWNSVDKRFNLVKEKTGISNEELEELKKRVFERTGLKRNEYIPEECLYSVEYVPEYNYSIKAFSAMATNDSIMKQSILVLLAGSEEDADKLIKKYGVDVFDPILSLFSALGQKTRLRLCINKNNKGIVN